MSSYKKTEMSDYLAFPIDVPLRFISGDPSSVHETAQYKYVGENRGAYSQAGQNRDYVEVAGMQHKTT